MRSNPHVIEIHARRWITELRRKYGIPVTLSTIPDREWLEFKRLGFDAVWLMGVWQASPASREIALNSETLNKQIAAVHPDYDKADIAASPQAILDYTLDSELGKPEELAWTHEKLNSMGLSLILDFVNNHLAIDHPMVKTCPSCFVQAETEDVQYHPNWFFKNPSAPDSFIAFGRDPNFEPWTDTAQLNLFNPETRKFLIDTLLGIAKYCDGVRCDMVMLTLMDIHDETWGWLTRKKGFSKPSDEFWTEAINAVRQEHPEFTFLGEVYWGLEWRVQQMGFDYTYDKVLYDRLRLHGPEDVRGHLRAEKMYQKRSLRFVENHDEAPAIAAFGREKAFAASLIIATLRGMRLFDLAQLMGVSIKRPIQYLGHNLPIDPDVYRRYSELLKIADHPAFHGGEWTLIEPRAVAADDSTYKNILTWCWVQRKTYKLVAVNYADTISKARIPISAKPHGATYTFYDDTAGLFFTRPADEVKEQGLFVELPPYGAHVLDLEL